MTRQADQDPTVRRVVDTLKETPSLDPELTRRVMASVRTSDPESWWLARSVRLAPIHVLAAAAAFVILVAGAWLAASGSPDNTPSTAGEPRQVVQFHLVAPGADSVMLVGDFNDWELGVTPLHRAGRPGVWTVDVSLSPGLVKYAFVIDGHRWVTDPAAAATISDDFGGAASYLRVGGPS